MGSKTDLVSLRAVVRGRVQGVFFRESVRARADHLNVSGYVRNRSDGTVEVWAEGERYQLEKLSEYLYVGPPAARVEKVDVEWDAATGDYNGFSVRA
jgi:acylphosphatase